MRIAKETWIVSTAVSAALGITLFLMMPQPAMFTTEGEIVPIRTVGIEGSVYFVQVDSGVTRNRFERYMMPLMYRDKEIVFEPVEGDPDAMADWLSETETLEETVRHAVDTVLLDEEAAESESEPPLASDRVDEIMANLEGYSGNSIGLMAAIGLYEEKHGIRFGNAARRIAGTGTMEEDGSVGPVGAVELKMIGADAAGADLFFVPADAERYGDAGNEAEAMRVKEERGLRMTVVPVASFQEAIDYLHNMKEAAWVYD